MLLILLDTVPPPFEPMVGEQLDDVGVVVAVAHVVVVLLIGVDADAPLLVVLAEGESASDDVAMVAAAEQGDAAVSASRPVVVLPGAPPEEDAAPVEWCWCSW